MDIETPEESESLNERNIKVEINKEGPTVWSIPNPKSYHLGEKMLDDAIKEGKTVLSLNEYEK